MADGRHHGKGEHDQGDMAMPAVTRTGFVMIEAQLVLRGFETVFDSPAIALDPNQGLNNGSCRTPCREKCQISVRYGSADQQSAGPETWFRCAKLGRIEIRQLQIGPAIEARPFGPFAR